MAAWLRSRSAVMIGVAVASLLVVLGGVVIGYLVAAPAGSVAEWVAALATVAAFAGASVAVWYASQALRVELARDARRFEAERRAQAALVHIAMDVETEGHVTERFAGGQHSTTYHRPVIPVGATLHLTNASQLPVYDVQVHFYDSPDIGETGPQYVASHGIDEVAPGRQDLPVVFDDETRTAFQRRLESRSNWPPASAQEYRPPEIRLSWNLRDAAGVRWSRRGGVLHESDDGH
jgi:hypothetical protein